MLPFEHIIIIDKENKVPVYKQIAFSITKAIQNGTLKAGAHLPGSRELAKSLGVHRKTVMAAYDELSAQDWIVIIPRKYISVAERIPVLKPQKWSAAPSALPYQHDFRIGFRTVDNGVEKTNTTSKPEIIIDDGCPDVRLSPIDALLRTYRSYTSFKYAIKDANTSTEQGTVKLREELAHYLSETRGLNIAASNLLITHGAQMGIFVAARLLLGPGSNVVVGKPNYPSASSAFEETGAQLIAVSIDEHGIDVDEIEAVCKKKKVTAVYVIPHHHYPTTVTLSAERRVKLLKLSIQFSFAIIEDDYDYDYHYTASPYLPLASCEHDGNVIYIGSFSKMLEPSLRIGFMVAPENFIMQCVALRKIIDVGGDGYMQNALAALIKSGELKRHVKKAKKCYRQRRDSLDALLRDKLGKYISYTLPSGGMAIWVKLNPEFSVTRLVSHPKLKIYRVDIEHNAFRFGFASMNEKELEQAVAFLYEMFSGF
ncbi:MocR-like pyridoxine biosynthesis transcription factor PdxR [Chitinophaga flava]|uniref:PLP-dependent aminotransferase family protein n=1 Tax=Chitinophaga flava TaxID=2259036 RepID=A0A365Y042_9BACT|nr:PLP-dependent aminotransferase family protein [Chitinophaga flava]RBL91976.1 PLP-dependent aminotransferase family protein [Chitinophaga flava]